MPRFVRPILSLLPALSLWAAAPLSAADLEFSHKLHLGKVGLTCTFCHAPAGRSATVADDNVPRKELCLACHDGQTAPEIDVSPWADRTAAERVFAFSHEQHLALGDPGPKIAAAIDSGKYLGHVGGIRSMLDSGNACMSCHRGLADADQVDSKAHLPRMSDCLVCHDKIDNPFSCEECHPRDFAIKPASHTPNFIDQHSSGKMGFDKLTCQPCHGKKFTCMGCH